MSIGWDVEVVMATHNGARYLPEQLRSIEGQVDVQWRLLVGDDCSSDGTPAVVEAFRRRYPDRVEVLPVPEARLGPAQAFGRLLAHTTAPFVALCDQDDFWYPTRLAETVSLARERGAGRPVLVHSDLEVVDQWRRCLHPSLNRYQLLGAHRRASLRHLLVQNSVTGCAVTVNRSLLQLALPIPAAAVMHDWWMALVASALGEVRFIPKSLVAYRQHGSNALGARRAGWLAAPPAVARMRASLRATFTQSQALVDRFGGSMAPESLRVARRYAEMQKLGPVQRRLRSVGGRYFKEGVVRNIGMQIAL